MNVLAKMKKRGDSPSFFVQIIFEGKLGIMDYC